VPPGARSRGAAAGALGHPQLPRGRAYFLAYGSPSDLEVRSACNILQSDLWKKRTFRRLLGAVRTLSFASVKGDSMYMVPRDHDWGLTVDDLSTQKYQYLRMLEQE
jgi:hypothetical protein